APSNAASPERIPVGRTEVQERIRRAQQAILNPSRPTSDFIHAQPLIIEQNEHSFSRDLISVRISGRDVDDLSFVDLPGIITSVRQGGHEADIKEVENLVMSFITKPSCLILLVVSCESRRTSALQGTLSESMVIFQRILKIKGHDSWQGGLTQTARGSFPS
ncbi:hypothetical protein FRC16_007684, partial [Serendipita sp. 398]